MLLKVIVVLIFLMSTSCSSRKTQPAENIPHKDGDLLELQNSNDPLLSTEEDEVAIDGDIVRKLEKYEKESTGAKADNLFDDESKITAFNDSIRSDIGNLYYDDDSDGITDQFISEEDHQINSLPQEQNVTEDFNTYHVKEHETLIYVAFKLYARIDKWRELASINSNSLAGNYNLTPGQIIKYRPESIDINWPPSGIPYLILKGDYLSKISHNVYGDYRYWRAIFHNNKVMIKDPDLIFAGFTLYYPAKSQVLTPSRNNASTSQ